MRVIARNVASCCNLFLTTTQSDLDIKLRARLTAKSDTDCSDRRAVDVVEEPAAEPVESPRSGYLK